MANPLQTGKQSVNLGAPGAGASRIRRDPPPVVKAKVGLDPDEREQWAVVVGILTFALAIFVIIIAFGSYSGWSPSQYTVQMGCEASGSEC